MIRGNNKQEFEKGYEVPSEIYEMQKNIIELIYNCELEENHEIQANLLKTRFDEQVL